MKSDICTQGEEGRLAACGNLRDAIGGLIGRVSIRRLDHRQVAVLYAGKYQHQGGVVMNYCPFCGERIFSHDTTASPPPS